MSDDNSRNKPVTMYYTADEKAAIKREANDAGKTVSTYCRDLVDRQRRATELEELNAEERIERIVAQSTDRFEEVAEDIRDQQGLVIHLLRELEDELDGLEVDALDDVDTDRDPSDDSDGPKGVDDLL